MLQRLGFSDAAERLPLNIPDQTDDPNGLSPIMLHPPREVSNAAASNSKFLNDFVKREALLALLRCKQAALHRFRFQEVSRLSFGFNVAPQRDRNDHGRRLAALIGHVLDLSFRHRLQFTPFQWQERSEERRVGFSRPPSG